MSDKEIEQKYLIPDTYNIPEGSIGKLIQQSHLGDHKKLSELLQGIQSTVTTILQDSHQGIESDRKIEFHQFLQDFSKNTRDAFAGLKAKKYKVRVRIKGEGEQQKATLTAKAKIEEGDLPKGTKIREEYTEEISLDFARFLLETHGYIEKRRYKVPFATHILEIDVYEGENAGIRTADIEFDNPHIIDTLFVPPEGFYLLHGDDAKPYKNKNLQRDPFKKWSVSDKTRHHSKVS